MKPHAPLLAKLCLPLLAPALALGAASAQAAPAKRPNILLIVADDLGYTDLGAYGAEISTPNLDKLASGGVKMTGFYASPFCSPTRAMLMSGSDNHLVGFGDMAELMLPEQRGKPGYEGYLNERVVPMAQVLKDAGYRTAMAGKWHLGVKEEFSPATSGFEQSYAMVMGGASHWGDQSGIVAMDPAKPPKAIYRENGKAIDIPRDGFYSSQAFTDKLLDYLKSGEKSGKPFFGYLAFTAPTGRCTPRRRHRQVRGPLQGRLRQAAQGAPRAHEAPRHRPADTPVYEGHAHWPKWDSLTPAQQEAEARRMTVYSAMVDHMDRQIGRVLDYLKAKGELDNTFIFFMSDNGADGNSVYDVGRTREWIEKDMDNSTANTGKPGSFIEYGPGWAQVGSTPFKLYKSFMYEGGIAVPAIAWGPGIKGGAIKREFAHVTDVAPTIFELAGARHPGTEYQGKPVLPLRGKSMVSWLQGQGQHGARRPGRRGLGARRPQGAAQGRLEDRTPTSPGARTAGSSTTSPRTAPKAATWPTRTPRSSAR
jgi:arylsulfatase